MSRRRWLPRGAGVGYSALALFTASSCYRAEIKLSDLMDDMMQGGTSPSTAGVSGSTSGTGAADAPGGGGSAGDANENAAGQGGASEPPCIDEPLEPEQQVCFDLGPPARGEECPGDPSGWQGCYVDDCLVCSKSVVDFLYYFDWHPCCKVNASCASNKPLPCNPLCPRPTERDKRPPCDRVGLE